ncbi:Uncharacterised protein [Acinetobacter baumannii]|nr:Uncharacterised protein [Acinetobacter baumannii]
MPSQSAQGSVPLYLPFQSREFSAVCSVSTATALLASVVCTGVDASEVVSVLFSCLLHATRRVLISAIANNDFFIMTKTSK